MHLRLIGIAKDYTDSQGIHYGHDIRALYGDFKDVALCGVELEAMYEMTAQRDKVCKQCRDLEPSYDEIVDFVLKIKDRKERARVGNNLSKKTLEIVVPDDNKTEDKKIKFEQSQAVWF
jgi:hypothetical protein